jgi:serine/threonine protein kinase
VIVIVIVSSRLLKCRQIGVDMPESALIQELAPGGVLGDLLHKTSDPLSRELKKKMTLDLAAGLAYLHARDPPTIHRDLRSFNVFVMSLAAGCDVNVKIGDFGLSLQGYVPSDEPLESWQWLAPEVCMKNAGSCIALFHCQFNLLSPA